VRVAYIAKAPFISGAERSLQIAVGAMPTAGVEPVVICPPDSPLAAWCDETNIEYAACPIVLRDRWHPIAWWRSVAGIRRALKHYRIDLVHSNQVWSYQAAGKAAAELGLPRVCHMRDEVSGEALRWCLGVGVEALVCISRHIERQVTDAWPWPDAKPRMRTFINPVLPVANSSTSGRPLNSASTTLGFIGQIVPVKGLTVLLEALASLASQWDWKLIVAGRDPNPGSPHEQECRDLSERLNLTDRVEYLGYLEDVSVFYNRVDVVIVPSLEEPLGRIPLEAASYGVPAIASDAGGLPETVCDGTTGWLSPKGDAAALRQTIARCLEKRDIEMGQRAQQWVAERCNPEEHARRLAELYATLLAAKAASHSERQLENAAH
jgi:glycosyltransferase involved in cell wall biosynthesis